MTVQDALRKIKVMLAVEEEVVAVTEDIKMADAELIDGTVVYTEGEMVVGATLLVRVDEGEESPYAPEGLHETTDGMIVVEWKEINRDLWAALVDRNA